MVPWPQVATQDTQISMSHSVLMALRQLHGLRQQPRPLTSNWPLMATQAIDIITNPSCGRATHRDITLDGRPGLDITMALGGCRDSYYLPVLHCCYVFSSTSLHSAQVAQLHFLTHCSTAYSIIPMSLSHIHLFMIVAAAKAGAWVSFFGPVLGLKSQGYC